MCETNVIHNTENKSSVSLWSVTDPICQAVALTSSGNLKAFHIWNLHHQWFLKSQQTLDWSFPGHDRAARAQHVGLIHALMNEKSWKWRYSEKILFLEYSVLCHGVMLQCSFKIHSQNCFFSPCKQPKLNQEMEALIQLCIIFF